MRHGPFQNPRPHHGGGPSQIEALAERDRDRRAMNGDFVAGMNLHVVVEADMGVEAFAGLLDLDRAADVKPARLGFWQQGHGFAPRIATRCSKVCMLAAPNAARST